MTTTAKKSATYAYTARNIEVTRQGVQSTGKNVGLAFAMGKFVASVKNKAGETIEVTKMFKAFDRNTAEGKQNLTPASRLLELTNAGTGTLVLKGGFTKGRARDAADAKKGNYQDLVISFVSTEEEHAEYKASKAAAKASVEA